MHDSLGTHTHKTLFANSERTHLYSSSPMLLLARQANEAMGVAGDNSCQCSRNNMTSRSHRRSPTPQCACNTTHDARHCEGVRSQPGPNPGRHLLRA